MMHISDAKFQEHCVIISRDIVYSVFYHFLVANNMTSSLI